MASASGSGSAPTIFPKPKSDDPSWKHCERAEGNNVICNYCGMKMGGGVYRLKFHIARLPGNEVAICNQSPPEAQRELVACLASYAAKKAEKKRKTEALAAIVSRREPRNYDVDLEDSSIAPNPSRGRDSSSGNSVSMANFFVPRSTPGSQPSLEGTAWNKEKHNEARIAAANFWFYNNIPFNVAKSPYWENMVNAFTVAGKGFKAPTPHDFSGQLLEDSVKYTQSIVDEQKKVWQKKGCTILSDGWTDGKNRTLINFLVASSGQLVFLKSIDASNEIKSANTLCEMLDAVVMEVGVENVVQVVTDNAAAYVAAGRLLEARHPTLCWSPCAAHCIDLLLEDLGKMPWVKSVVDDAKNVTKFIYNHTWVLNLMREYTNGKELVRAGVTRFATNFLTLQSIATSLTPLKQMFVSTRWLESPYAKRVEGEMVMKTVFDDAFAKRMDEIIKVSEPLVRVLRLVDGERNPMGYLYEAMDVAKEAIANYYGKNQRKYEPIWRIIDRRWNKTLHRHIHAAAYYLNPKFFYSDSFKADEEVMDGLHSCIERMIPDELMRDTVMDELQFYKNATGRLFSAPLCIKRRYTSQPGTSVDILKVGGYKLSALEIEAILLEHPDISECAVLGLPDKDYGEVICAVAVPEGEAKTRAEAKSEPAISLQDLQNWAKEKIAPYKIPGRLHVWNSLPHNAMGKVNKKELKQLLLNA